MYILKSTLKKQEGRIENNKHLSFSYRSMSEIDILAYEQVVASKQDIISVIPDYIKPFLADETVRIGYTTGNEYTTTIQSFWSEIDTYFHKIALHEKGHEQYDIIITCFSDMVKLFIVTDWIKQGWTDEKIKRALVLMRNEEHFYCTFNGEPLYKEELDKLLARDNTIGDYLSNKSSLPLYMEWEFGTKEEQEHRKQVFQEVDEVFSVIPFYTEKYSFERVLFDIVNNNSSYYLIVCYDEHWEIDAIEYSNHSNLSDILFTTRWAEVYRIDGYLIQIHNNKLDLWEQLKASKWVIDAKRERKREKVEFLEHIKSQVISLWEALQRHKQGTPKYKVLFTEKTQYENLILRVENELELKDYYIYDYMKETAEILPTLPPIKNISEFIKHMKGLVDWKVAIEIEHKSLKSIEVFRKEFMKTQAQLRATHPYAEIWWQLHKGRHKFSTIRYKKDIE